MLVESADLNVREKVRRRQRDRDREQRQREGERGREPGFLSATGLCDAVLPCVV